MRSPALLTALTHMLLRRTVRRWFEAAPSVPVMRRKIDAMISLTDPFRLSRAAHAGERLYAIAPARKPAADAPLVLYFHGGGYLVGGLKTHGAFCARLAAAIRGRVLFSDYRLAPEHSFPAALEDGMAALATAARQATGRLIIAGDSAGGGLALAVTQAAIAQGLRAPDRVVLLSPWLDLTLSGASMTANARSDSMLSMQILTRMRGFYLGAQEPADRRASPLFDPNAHLPPVLVIYSASEVLKDDSTRLIATLRPAGSVVEALEMPGKPHVFPLLRTVPGAGLAMRRMREFITRSDASP